MIRIALAVTAALFSTAAASAADLIIPVSPEPIYEAAGFSWDGLYVGARAGGQWFTAATYADVGGVAGFNFMASDTILLGLEATADYTWNSTVNRGWELFGNARAGFVLSDSAMVYALGGLGVYTSSFGHVGLYQLGGGVEFAVTDAITIRGELAGQGSFNTGGRFFDAAKATVGLSYHF